MFMWTQSDRAIPRSYLMMQGFGVNTFTLTNSKGERHFVKFIFKPELGVLSFVWDVSFGDPTAYAFGRAGVSKITYCIVISSAY